MRRLRPGWSVLFAVLTVVGAARADDAPTDARGWKTRADDLVEQGLLTEAVELYGRALALGDDPSTHYNRGRALASLGQYPAAIADLDAFQSNAPPELRARVPGLPEFLARLRTRVSAVHVTCDADGAQVRLRGVDVGTTPLARDVVVNAGPATLEIRKDGYFPYKRDVDLPGGGGSVFDVHLASKVTMGVVTITSPVVGATVSVDDAPLGAVPLEAPLQVGAHRVVVTHDGYRPATSTVLVEAGVSREVRVPLEKEASIVNRWWFWTVLGVGVAAGGVAVYALTTERSLEKGSLPPGNFTVGFRGF